MEFQPFKLQLLVCQPEKEIYTNMKFPHIVKNKKIHAFILHMQRLLEMVLWLNPLDLKTLPELKSIKQ